MTVIAGYMPTEAGRLIVDAAVREARLRKLPLLIVNSATGSAYADRGLATEKDLNDLRAYVADVGIDVQVKQVADAVSVTDTLIQIAEEIDAELLVIGLRQRTRTGKFLLGSTAQTIILQSPCDVMSVRLHY